VSTTHPKAVGLLSLKDKTADDRVRGSAGRRSAFLVWGNRMAAGSNWRRMGHDNPLMLALTSRKAVVTGRIGRQDLMFRKPGRRRFRAAYPVVSTLRVVRG